MISLQPEYLWRPAQVLRRLAFRPQADAKIRLPWRCSIGASSKDAIGYALATRGVYDLPLTEAIMRLADPGDRAVDVGANIGHTALVLALSVGRTGRVTAFEPNRDLLPRLSANIAAWQALQISPIQVISVALSNRDGIAQLVLPSDYNVNCGTGTLQGLGNGVPVEIRRLDSLEHQPVGLMKVDVEGHEAAVFAGAEQLVKTHSVRDILFEEHAPFPAQSHRLLLDCGYRIFRLTGSFWRPILLAPEASARQANLPSNFLATIDPGRAISRFRGLGWASLIW